MRAGSRQRTDQRDDGHRRQPLPPGTLRAFWLSLAGRIPLGAISVVLVLHGRDVGLSYALSGVLGGAFALGMAFGAPVIGRLVDRRGPSLPLLVAGAIASLATAATGLVPDDSAMLCLPLALLAGASQPPVAACARAWWGNNLDPARLRTLLGMDAAFQEISYVVGPLALVTWAATFGSRSALVAAAVVLGVVSSAFALSPEMRAVAPSPRTGRVSSLLARRPTQTLALIAVVTGGAIGMLQIAVISIAEEMGTEGAVGVYYAMWGLGGLVGGLLGVAAKGSRVVARLVVLLVAMAATEALISVADDPVTLCVILVVSGAPAAVMLAAFYELVGRTAPAGRVTEAFTWGATGNLAGVAAGSAVAGVMLEAWDADRVLFAAAACLLVGAATAALWRSTLAPSDGT